VRGRLLAGGPARAAAACAAALLLLLAAAAPPPARAQTGGGPPAPAATPESLERKPIREIVFEGARRHSQAHLREQVRLKVGDPFSTDAMNQDVIRLYRSGLVDWTVEGRAEAVPGGVRVLFTISELEEVKEVVYDGLSAVSARDLQESPEGMRIRAPKDERPGTTFEEYRAHLDKQTILRMVREKGKFFAEVDVEREELERGVRVIFRVREGPTVRVDEIDFVGNESIEADELRRYMRTQTHVLYFIRSGYFDRKAVDEDVSNLARYYWGEGYLDVRVFVEDISFSEDRSRARVTLRVVEGKRYKVRKVEVLGVTLFLPEEVKGKLETREGTDFSGRRLAGDLEKIQKLYMDKGYIFNRVDFRRRLVEGKHEIDLAFTVEEGVKVTLEKVRFEGNVKTRDDVVRREASIFPGEPFSAEAMDETKDRLGRRGYFKDLRVSFEPGTSPDKRDLIVRLEEADTGQLLFGGGVSSSTGFFGRVVFTQRNFDILDIPTSLDDVLEGKFLVGGGQQLQITAEPGQKRSRYSVSFVEPYFLADLIPLPVQLRTQFTYYDSVLAPSYEEQRIEPVVGAGYRLTRDALVELAYRYSDIDVLDVEPFAPPDVIEVAGQNHVSALSLGVYANRNKQDISFVNYGGWAASLEAEVAGGPVGGEHDFVRVEANANAQLTLFTWPRDSKHVIGVRGTAGLMEPFGHSRRTPIFERFYAGGPRSVRGFEFRSVGPQADDDPTGGNVRMVGTVEYSFPIIPGFDQTYAPEWRADFLRAVLFCDAGNVEEDLDAFTFDDFRVSLGFGFRVKIPLFPAPVALDFGFPIREEKGDDTEIFSFTVGGGF
jgi:outer membrane protein assembly complex protein YaeT